MKRSFKRGECVSVPYGLETRVAGRITAGPFKYTSEEVAQNKEVNAQYGYSTNRMAKSYYHVRVGRGLMLDCAVTHIRVQPKRA